MKSAHVKFVVPISNYLNFFYTSSMLLGLPSLSRYYFILVKVAWMGWHRSSNIYSHQGAIQCCLTCFGELKRKQEDTHMDLRKTQKLNTDCNPQFKRSHYHTIVQRTIVLSGQGQDMITAFHLDNKQQQQWWYILFTVIKSCHIKNTAMKYLYGSFMEIIKHARKSSKSSTSLALT